MNRGMIRNGGMTYLRAGEEEEHTGSYSLASEVLFSCEVCGGTNVQHAMWVDLNTDKVEDDYGSWCGDGNSWCCDCEAHTPITVEKKK